MDVKRVAESFSICASGASRGCDGCLYFQRNEMGDNCQWFLNGDIADILDVIVGNESILAMVQNEVGD